MKCQKCGYEASRAEFRYIGPLAENEGGSMRKCPKCQQLTPCDDLSEDESAGREMAWGMKALGRRKSRKETKPDADL